MNDEIRAEIEETIRIISENIITQMMNEDKNTYDKEIRLPENVTTPHVVTKRAYNRITGTMYDEKNKKRRQKRPSVLEQCILNGKLEEAEKKIRRMQYTAITNISQTEGDYCNEKTAKRILEGMFAMIGYEAKSIPNTLKEETMECLKKWLPHAKTIYNYNKGKIARVLNMTQDEMSCIYDTYILTKKIILINSLSKAEYDKNIAGLNKNLNPVYAAIRALREIE